MKELHDWTKEEFLALPFREDWALDVECASIVIIPMDQTHDSNFQCMDFIAIDKDQTPICRLSGCSDIIHIDGIGGMGRFDMNLKDWPDKNKKVDWSIDCLRSGFLRLFPGRNGMTCGAALSSFEIYANKAK